MSGIEKRGSDAIALRDILSLRELHSCYSTIVHTHASDSVPVNQ